MGLPPAAVGTCTQRATPWIRCGGRIEGQEEVGMVGRGGLAGDDKAGWSELDRDPGRYASAPHFSSTSLLPDARGKNFRSPAKRKQNAHQLLVDIMVVAQKPAKRLGGMAKALAIAEDLGFPAPPCFIVFCSTFPYMSMDSSSSPHSDCSVATTTSPRKVKAKTNLYRSILLHKKLHLHYLRT